ncbi:MAG TPA: hypothetical protein VI895_01515 [Bdellovibrionota bacterium]|nr:hypothetical protein [Bdellovibrionota bacterium]
MKRDLENITLTLPRPLLRKLRIAAAEANQSVSRLLAKYAHELISRKSLHQRAFRKEMRRMAKGLYEVGKVTWSRDALHVRK